MGVRIAKANNSVFVTLPFPVECDENPFGKSPEIKRGGDISSMTPAQLKQFVEQCELVDSLVAMRMMIWWDLWSILNIITLKNLLL